MAQWLRALVALAEALGSVPSTHIAAYNGLTPLLEDLMLWALRSCDAHTYMVGKTLIYIYKIILKN